MLEAALGVNVLALIVQLVFFAIVIIVLVWFAFWAVKKVTKGR